MVRMLRAAALVVLAVMVGATLAASLERGVLEAARALWPDPWFRATLADAYFGFLWIWAFVAWRERSWAVRGTWLAAFLALGNFAIAAYVLWTLRGLPSRAPADALFARRPVAG